MKSVKPGGWDPSEQARLTGVHAALAATGSVAALRESVRYRAASLLPPLHVAAVAASRILPASEIWWRLKKTASLAQHRQHSNIVSITEPRTTTDIATPLVMRMHGPRELHLVFLADAL